MEVQAEEGDEDEASDTEEKEVVVADEQQRTDSVTYDSFLIDLTA